MGVSAMQDRWSIDRVRNGSAVPPAPIGTLPITRQRTKLWELTGSVHCSVIGTCLTTAELRRAMARLAKTDIAHISDHDLHSEAVGLCGHNNLCSKLLQKTLDQRHLLVIKQFSRLQGEAAVLEKWREARQAGDIPGAYWAVLTHPDLGHTGLRQAFGDVHMLSHLIGSANRADVKRLAVLETEKTALLAKVERQQMRLQEAITTRDATIRRLGLLAVAKPADATGMDGDEAVATLRHLAADLQARLANETGRRERLEQRLTEAAETARLWEQRARDAEAEREALAQELAVLDQPADEPARQPTALPAERILYVGGRPGPIGQMRDALTAAGGELLCHDGGQHDHPSLLPGLISQADRVVFPVDCVSHDAALAVKRVCRQLDKPFVPLRSSGLASFLTIMRQACPACAST